MFKKTIKQPDPSKKTEPYSQRIRFSLTAQELRTLIGTSGLPQTKVSPKVERIEFSMPVSKLRAIVFTRSEAVTKQTHGGNKATQPQKDDYVPAGTLVLFKILHLLALYVIFTAIGVATSVEFAESLFKTYASIPQLIGERIENITAASIALFCVTLIFYYSAETLTDYKFKRLIGVINGLSIFLAVAVVFLRNFILNSLPDKHEVDVLLVKAHRGSDLVSIALDYGFLGLLYVFALAITGLLLTIFLTILGNKEYKFIL